MHVPVHEPGEEGATGEVNSVCLCAMGKKGVKVWGGGRANVADGGAGDEEGGSESRRTGEAGVSPRFDAREEDVAVGEEGLFAL